MGYVHGHCLSQEPNSFPTAKLEDKVGKCQVGVGGGVFFMLLRDRIQSHPHSHTPSSIS